MAFVVVELAVCFSVWCCCVLAGKDDERSGLK